MAASALVVEDHPLYRDALRQLLERIFGADRVCAAASAEEGLRQASASPGLRLVLLDPGLPGMNGVEAIVAFRRQCPDAALIAVSASEERRDAMAAFRAGALAFVSKAASTEVLADLVRRAAAGELREPAWVTPAGSAAMAEAPMPDLTQRQVEVLALLCQGHPNKEIGQRLNLAEVTVKMHVSSVFRALGVANRTQAVLEARRRGLLPAG
jgi:two-component system, NarL family, nitrate/nitrite response regulator NarL